MARTKIGEGPSPASPPPLNIEGLRQEMGRETGPPPVDSPAPVLSRVEQMLAEVGKARDSLHEDTARLEALMLQDAREAAAAAEPAEGEGAAAGAPKPPAKNPLDILAKALRAMKPDQAAPIVARLDKHLAAVVLQRMPPVDAGKILAAMKPDAAAELATQIAMRLPNGGAKR